MRYISCHEVNFIFYSQPEGEDFEVKQLYSTNWQVYKIIMFVVNGICILPFNFIGILVFFSRLSTVVHQQIISMF